MTASLFIKIGNATERVAKHDPITTLVNRQEYVQLCKDFYSFISNSNYIDLDVAGKVDEFHSFGIVGAPNGEIMASMIWAVAKYPEFWGKAVQAKNVFVVGNPGEVLVCSSAFDKKSSVLDIILLLFRCQNQTLHLLVFPPQLLHQNMVFLYNYLKTSS